MWKRVGKVVETGGEGCGSGCLRGRAGDGDYGRAKQELPTPCTPRWPRAFLRLRAREHAAGDPIPPSPQATELGGTAVPAFNTFSRRSWTLKCLQQMSQTVVKRCAVHQNGGGTVARARVLYHAHTSFCFD